jgi:hypothetical protein
LAFNKTENIPELWEVVSSVYTEPEYQVVAARRFREAMMKASILVGFPRVTIARQTGADYRESTDLSLYEDALQMNLLPK